MAKSTFLGSLPNIPLRTMSIIFVIVAAIAAVGVFVSDGLVNEGYRNIEQANDRFIQAQQAASDLEAGSDQLTYCVRSFVATGDVTYLNGYFEEAEVTRQRDNAVDSLEELLQGEESEAFDHLNKALSLSNELMHHEYRAMKLTVEADGIDVAVVPEVVMQANTTLEEEAMSADEKRALAQVLVFGKTYANYKTSIKSHAELSTQELVSASDEARLSADQNMNTLLTVQTILTILFLVVVLLLVVFVTLWVRIPLSHMVLRIQNNELVPPTGATELRFVAKTYNAMFEENKQTYARLSYGSTHDALTGLLNRKAYDVMLEDMDMSNTALLLIDVDKFKSINDTHGHDVGDLLLKRVAEVLRYSFRSTDLVFRLGGDEFVVIMSDVDSSVRDKVRDKIDQANVMLQKPKDDLPPTSLSVGVAFADRENPDGDIFKDADTALYRVKEAGRCGCVIY